MKLKLITHKDCKHSDVASCIGWASPTDLYTVGDDHVIKKWSMKSDESSEVAKLPQEIYCTDIHWFPSVGIASKKHTSQSELFALACTNGRTLLVSRSGRVEKSVDAHKGAVLGTKWLSDGTALLTYGEDGAIKVWSRNGMLRSVLAQNAIPVYGATWSPDSQQILYTSGKTLVIKPLQPSLKPSQWKAHEGIVLTLDWNKCNGLIVSGGEDRKYKVWDSYGRNLFSSALHDTAIVSSAWSPNGELFAVAGFNTLRLCDKSGWSYSLDKPECGTVLRVSWSSDGTQLAGATGSGQVLFGQVVNRRMEWNHIEAVVTSEREITVKNIVNSSIEKLEFDERIVKSSLHWGYLVVTTPTKCFVYREKNWTTPVNFELKSGAVTLLKQTERFFVIVENVIGVQIISYEGRVLNNLKYPGLRPDSLDAQTITVSNDTVVIRDCKDHRVLHVFDVLSGRELGVEGGGGQQQTYFQHKTEIEWLCISQSNGGSGAHTHQRLLAFIDKNHELYVCLIREKGNPVLLASMVTSICWNDQYNILATTQDRHLVMWYHPAIVFTDKDLLHQTSLDKQKSGYPKNPHIVSFIGNHCTLRRSDGALVRTQLAPFPALLHQYVLNSQWSEAIRLCRMAKDNSLWACLAGMAAAARELATAITAYGAIDEVNKVHFLNHILSIQSTEYRNAEMALFCHQHSQAELLHIQGGNIFQAIQLNMQLYRWDRALELAVKHKTHVDTVLAFRQKYLQDLGLEETVKTFKQYNDKIQIDWDKVNAKVRLEQEKVN